jgi:predicted dehydrogenase
METRRKFIGQATRAGLLISATIPCLGGFASLPTGKEKKLVIGIIGAENSHTIGLGKLFNVDKRFPGVELKYVWGETDQFARAAMEKGNIPFQVKDPLEMLGKIDALIVDHRHPKFHLKPAIPFVREKIPTFVDKPFCYRADEGKEFLQLAKKLGTPVSSYSSISYSTGTFDIIDQLKSMEKVTQVVRTGRADFESEYGGIFFYGIHALEPLMFMFGEDINELKVTRNGKQGSAILRFSSGLSATLVFKDKSYSWETYVETGTQWKELKPRREESNPAKNYTDMVEMFQTGKEPRTHQSILNTISVLEALEKSGKTEKWTTVKYVWL